MTSPSPPREASLIKIARKAAGLSVAAASEAALIDISAARWSQIENGYEARGGRHSPVRGRDETIAHMAYVVGVAPERLSRAGRANAGLILEEIMRRQAEPEPYIDDADMHEVWLAASGLPDSARHGMVRLARRLRDSGGNGTAEQEHQAHG